MPLFVGRYHTLQKLDGLGLTRHPEITTYAWEQLPADLKIPLPGSLGKSIAKSWRHSMRACVSEADAAHFSHRQRGGAPVMVNYSYK